MRTRKIISGVLIVVAGLFFFSAPAVLAQDCEGNFDCDQDVDGTDAAVFKEDFGRSAFSNPCDTCLDSPCPCTTTDIDQCDIGTDCPNLSPECCCVDDVTGQRICADGASCANTPGFHCYDCSTGSDCPNFPTSCCCALFGTNRICVDPASTCGLAGGTCM